MRRQSWDWDNTGIVLPTLLLNPPHENKTEVDLKEAICEDVNEI